MAKARVINALFNLETFILINPSIIYYPDNVPVKVELYPAASKPIPQIYLAATPKFY